MFRPVGVASQKSAISRVMQKWLILLSGRMVRISSSAPIVKARSGSATTSAALFIIIDPDDFAAGKITVIGVERKERRNGAAIVEPPHEDFETMRMEAVEDGLEVRVL
jgi:hypothetical protein